jgi:hypothetical protein
MTIDGIGFQTTAPIDRTKQHGISSSFVPHPTRAPTRSKPDGHPFRKKTPLPSDVISFERQSVWWQGLIRSMRKGDLEKFQQCLRELAKDRNFPRMIHKRFEGSHRPIVGDLGGNGTYDTPLAFAQQAPGRQRQQMIQALRVYADGLVTWF